MKYCTVGIDTSNYTTSVAAVDENLSIIANLKYPLPVRAGECGLRQSDAVFAHTKNLPEAFAALAPLLSEYTPIAVGVSEKPRNQEDSYMPCFLTGVSAAEGISSVAKIPCYRFSHQCGHLMAAILGAGGERILSAPFGAFHVSGGTTELVSARFAGNGFSCDVVGGSRDLHAGQVIDRIGVLLGLAFPAGPALEKLAMSHAGKTRKRKPSLDGCYCHLSGLENMAQDLLRETQDPAAVAAFVFDYIGASLLGMTDAYLAFYGEMPMLYAGGVMSSTLLQKRLGGHCDALFAPPALSADNAVGIATLTAYRAFNR